MPRALRRINREEVKAVPLIEKPDNRPVKGSDLFRLAYANIFLCARKNSGKTSTIYKILKECCGRNTTVIAFVATLNQDPSWLTIQKYCEVKKIPFVGNTSMKEDGVDLLQEFVDEQKALAKERQRLKEEGLTKPQKEKHLLFQEDEDEDGEEKPKKSKYLSPEYIIIFDDLSSELRNKALVSLLKEQRHWLCKVIISSQYLNDLLPASRKQIDFWLIFKGQPLTKLDIVHQDADVAITLEEMYDIYKIATQEKYSFMYLDRHRDEFRRNFNYVIE